MKILLLFPFLMAVGNVCAAVVLWRDGQRALALTYLFYSCAAVTLGFAGRR